MNYSEIMNMIKDLPDEQLKALSCATNIEIEERTRQHREKLWNDVVTAIKEYQKEVGSIVLTNWNTDEEFDIYSDSLSDTGVIYFKQ